jgi:hypothetical protein
MLSYEGDHETLNVQVIPWKAAYNSQVNMLMP